MIDDDADDCSGCSEEGWREVSWIGDSDYAVAGLAVDPVHELLWTATADGRVASYLAPSMERFSAARSAGPDDGGGGCLCGVAADPYGVCTLAPAQLRYHTKGALPTLALPLADAAPLHALSRGPSRGLHSSRAVAAGAARIVDVDLLAGRVAGAAPVPAPVVALCGDCGGGGRAEIFCGCATGTVLCVDARTLRVAATLDAHGAGVCALDARGDLLATCGAVRRMGRAVSDAYVRVFDVRTRRLLRSALVPGGGAASVRFYPQLASTLVAASQNGALRLVDALSAASFGPPLSGPLPCGAALTCLEVAPSGEAIFVGDSAGHVHNFAYSADGAFQANVYPAPLALPDPPSLPPDFPPIDVAAADDDDESAALSVVPFPEDGDGLPLASSMWNAPSFPIPQPPRPFDPVLVPAVVRWGLGSVISLAKLSKSQLKSLALAEPRLAARLSGIRRGAEDLGRPDKGYRHVDVKAKKKGDGDLSWLNATFVAGLENNLPNSFANALLQVLYFTPHIRAAALGHLCQREFCLTCELSFLFKMLDQVSQPGTVFSARNFLRALRQIPQAQALGIIENRTGNTLTTASGADLPMLLSTFSRFLFEQLHKELSSPAAAPTAVATTTTTSATAQSIVDSMLGFSSRTNLKCTNCTAEWQRSTRAFMVDLVDARNIPGMTAEQASNATFVDVAEASLCRTTQSKAWCDRCSHYQQTEQRKAPETLPPCLCFCSCAAREGGSGWPGLSASTAAPPTSDGKEEVFSSPWLPLRMSVAIDPTTGKATVREESDASAVQQEDGKAAKSIYELTALVCHITDPNPKTPATGHLVALVKVPQEYLESRGPVTATGSGGWFLINDFHAEAVSSREVVRFPSWKRPLIALYSCPEKRDAVPVPPVVSPISGAPFFSRVLLNLAPNVMPLVLPSPVLLPKRGQLIAFDSEYVSLSAEGIVSELDGTQVAVTPSHLSVARVTCIFGDGPLANEPLVDDFVVACEPVVDYLTRYSGIAPGDLDPTVSTKRLTTLKNVYLKLRYLIDSGCVFIGHGLRNDMKVLGLHLPRDQVLDTVELFHAEHQRWISLRFLAACLLHIDIQATVHDSVEDARTALALYNVYLRLKASGELKTTIQEIYRIGYASNWQLPLCQ